MKKHAVFLCLVAMLFALSACGNASQVSSEPPDTSAEPDPTATIELTPPEEEKIDSDNPLLQANFLTDAVLSGSGKNIGTYGYIEAKKSDIPDISAEEFAAYLSEFADVRVEDSGYNWVSIAFDDGTGICFFGAQTIIAEYGAADDEGCITRSFGTYIRGSDGYKYEENSLRSIPNPSLFQEALVPDNSFSPAPVEIFSTTAEENGLGDTPYYAEGTIVSRFDASGYDTIQVATEDGDLYISAVFVELPETSEGDTSTIYFVYTGWSNVIGGACGAYVYSE